MTLPVYLALTAEEFSQAEPLPPKAGFMACHFSPYGTGLTDIPDQLPPGTLLTVNDRIPMAGHSTGVILRQLQEAVDALSSPAVVLDLQLRDRPEAAALAEALYRELPCPVVVPPWYGEKLQCPLLVPPVPLHRTVEEYLIPWKGRQVWLELSLMAQEVTIREDGCRFSSAPSPENPTEGWEEDSLCCRYRHRVTDDHITITMWRSTHHLKQLLHRAGELGTVAALGLYQELGCCNFTEKTADEESVSGE